MARGRYEVQTKTLEITSNGDILINGKFLDSTPPTIRIDAPTVATGATSTVTLTAEDDEGIFKVLYVEGEGSREDSYIQSGAETVVIDLSGAYRLKDGTLYPRHYAFEHTRPALLAEAVYGLAERSRLALRTARLQSLFAYLVLEAAQPQPLTLVLDLDRAQAKLCRHPGQRNKRRRAVVFAAGQVALDLVGSGDAQRLGVLGEERLAVLRQGIAQEHAWLREIGSRAPVAVATV